MSPLEVMQRLAALVHRRQLHLIRFHDVLAPEAKLRAQVLPAGHDEDRDARAEAEGAEPHDPHCWSSRIDGTRLLERAFEIYMEHCPNCGSEPTTIADTHEAEVIEHMREHLELPVRGRLGGVIADQDLRTKRGNGLFPQAPRHAIDGGLFCSHNVGGS